MGETGEFEGRRRGGRGIAVGPETGLESGELVQVLTMVVMTEWGRRGEKCAHLVYFPPLYPYHALHYYFL